MGALCRRVVGGYSSSSSDSHEAKENFQEKGGISDDKVAPTGSAENPDVGKISVYDVISLFYR